MARKPKVVPTPIIEQTPCTEFAVGSQVLCNLKLSFQDMFNPWTAKGTIISMFNTEDKQFAKVDWSNGCLAYYRLDKDELIEYSDAVLKQRKLDAKSQKSKSVSEST
jgi:hypothetical protein